MPSAEVKFVWLAGALLIILLALLVLTNQRTSADGGVLQVNQRLDGHEVLVYTNRGPFVAEISIDVSVLVEHYPSGQLEPNASVAIEAHAQGQGGTARSFSASHDTAVNKAYYAAGLHLPAGRWQIVTKVHDGDWTGQVAFPLTVVPAAATGKVSLVSCETVTQIAGGLVILWAIWFTVRARRYSSGQAREQA